MGLFSGLEKFGLKTSDLNVYEEKKEEAQKGGDGAEAKPKEVSEEELIFDKTYKCPCCDNEFHAKAVRAGKVKLVATDSDLRPKYQQFDCLKYDAVVCPKCGYSAIARFYTYLTGAQTKLVKEQISAGFKGIKEPEGVYTYDNAIERYKLALVSTIVKRGKNSERAYTCLKLAWIIRGKYETLPKETPNYDNVVKELKGEELELLDNAYTGFNAAFSSEQFPMCGMDENTLMILLADLARRTGKKDECGRWVSSILVSRTCNDRIKNKAREIKEMMENL